MDENIFKQDAKSITDMLFDTKVFAPDVTRDTMNVVEEYIQYCMKTRYDSYVKWHELTQKHKSKLNNL